MKHSLTVTALCLAMALCPLQGCMGEGFSLKASEAKEPITTDMIAEAREAEWAALKDQTMSSSVYQQIIDEYAVPYGDVTMRYTIQAFGDAPENGYPLYIALHGGGSDDTPDFNDSQWEAMGNYYSEALTCGIYVAVRGVRDTWDTHFNPESYPMYDLLIRSLITAYDIDPNRVYLEGFSAGGDGVYAIACRMPDRFAAANMSSGHPNGISLINLYRLPMQLQAGEYDTAYDRHTVTAEYGLLLDELQERFGHFDHRTLIHYNCGHNYEDYSPEPIPVMTDVGAWLANGSREHTDIDSYPPDYMDAFVRDPLPDTVLWDLSTRADTRQTQAFYYLSAPWSTDQGKVRVGYDRANNRVTVETWDLNGPVSIMLNEDMVDFDQPVVFDVNGTETALTLVPDRELLRQTTADRGDPNYQFLAMVTLTPEE